MVKSSNILKGESSISLVLDIIRGSYIRPSKENYKTSCPSSSPKDNHLKIRLSCLSYRVSYFSNKGAVSFKYRQIYIAEYGRRRLVWLIGV